MKKIALGLIVSSVFIISGVGAQNTDIEPDEAAIHRAIESHVDAYNRGDVRPVPVSLEDPDEKES